MPACWGDGNFHLVVLVDPDDAVDVVIRGAASSHGQCARDPKNLLIPGKIIRA